MGKNVAGDRSGGADCQPQIKGQSFIPGEQTVFLSSMKKGRPEFHGRAGRQISFLFFREIDSLQFRIGKKVSMDGEREVNREI